MVLMKLTNILDSSVITSYNLYFIIFLIMTVSMAAAEAMATDPQVRLLMEVAYESLENGNHASSALAFHD